MSGKAINTQYQIPQQRGDLRLQRAAANDTRYTQQTSARLQVQQVYYNDINSRPAEAEVAPAHVRGGGTNPAFSEVEPFLRQVGTWMEFNRKEVAGNGRIS